MKTMAGNSGKKVHVQLSSEQSALAAQRKAKHAMMQATMTPTAKDLLARNHARILDRTWVAVPHEERRNKLKIMTWNLLAQTLVRRNLFPTSGACLKASHREPMIHREILIRDADIMCLQEVDRLDRLLPLLASAGYEHSYASGPEKKHGCLIAWKKDRFECVSTNTVQYDEQDIRCSENDSSRQEQLGVTFRTRNIGFMVALRDRTQAGGGFVVGTTHLFWHPKYTYERTRQTYILTRSILSFKSSLQQDTWPIIIGGDFNFPPSDATYTLLAHPHPSSSSSSLSPKQITQLSDSRVIHISIDPTQPIPTAPESIADDENDPDRIITHARPARPTDGLLSDEELVVLFESLPEWKSVYEQALRTLCASPEEGAKVRVFGDRVPVPPDVGYFEPEWTSYTHYWKTVLDYIFIHDPQSQFQVTGILLPPTTQEMSPGLPKTNVCGSDHVSLVAEISW